MAQVRTLSDLTDVISDDMQRSDLTTAISEAVADAIQFYQSERFWFSESRTVEFTTVASQMEYSSSDDSEIPTFISIDHAWIIRSGDQVWELKRITIGEWEQLADGSASSGEPYFYAYFNDKIYLYPDPNDAYTIRLTGHQGMIDGADAGASFGIGAPESADPNPYMRNAFELLRAHAKQSVYLHKLRDFETAASMAPAIHRALSALRRETGARAGKGCIVPTQF
jgi:hypothetical protein